MAIIAGEAGFLERSMEWVGEMSQNDLLPAHLPTPQRDLL